MDRKRKSTFATSEDDKKRQHKISRPRASRGAVHPGSAPIKQGGIPDRLNNAYGLDVNGIAPAVKQALFGLDKALRHAKSQQPKTDVAEPSTIRPEPSLPTLPPICDRTLEKAVFTHPGINGNIEATYDRLEILGDAYIELFATRLIWDRFHQIPSGRISQLRELLVKNESLAEYAIQYGFDRKANIPQDYLGQPKRWTKTMGDIFESYVAAIILSDPANGYSIAEKWLRRLWTPKLTNAGTQRSSLNAKDALARRIMGKGVKLQYLDEEIPIQESGGKQTFFIGVYLTGWGWTNTHLGSGRGPNKAIAGNEAAEQALSNEPLIGEVINAKKSHEASRH
ncbi:RNase3 domain protein [Aspergillus steynii IBT 23096]|uniref:RNase3 domain protein n=1 Tax=Aspergillus steynii IBT 23096 TaxID=1392250 RepID=A0A2I2FR31_9EURO|nr:RNase3 domain protein [Aspergillus steynii IBT 23096]PLB43085.1 RNase3 domain protein [Aspergillus steynii IBT 23096]